MKRHHVCTLIASAEICVGILMLASTHARAEDNGSDAAHCIQVSAEARYRALGYDHVVRVANACTMPADCVISTDVSPEPQRIAVPGGARIEAVTFIGSPARVFVPRVTCTMHK